MTVEIGHGGIYYVYDGTTPSLHKAADVLGWMLDEMERKRAKGKLYEIALEHWRKLCKEQQEMKARLAEACHFCGHVFGESEQQFVIDGQAKCARCLHVGALHAKYEYFHKDYEEHRRLWRIRREECRNLKRKIAAVQDGTWDPAEMV